MSGCELEAGCQAAPVARLAVGRTLTGATAYLTVLPAAYGHGGIGACADHVHTRIDGMLLTSLGPPEQPARERLDDPPGGPL